MSVLFSHTSLFCPSDKRRRNWKKGTMREARHGGFFFRSVFRSKCSDLVLRRPLLPVPWAMHTWSHPAHAPSIDRPMVTQVDGAVMADSEVRSARTTFAFFWEIRSEHFVSGHASMKSACFSRTTRPKYHWRTPRLAVDVCKACLGAMDASSSW